MTVSEVRLNLSLFIQFPLLYQTHNKQIPFLQLFALLAKELKEMKRSHPPITIDLDNGDQWQVFYKDSNELIQLRIFPYVQLSVIAIFLIIAYTVFNSIKKSEQNLVWVGMAKEAAHQLGTPISSLMGWLELVRMRFDAEDDNILNEMERDVKRLEIVADRFSKIGSIPFLSNYNATRYECIESEGLVSVNISETLQKKKFFIDISDTGKGIPKSNFLKLSSNRDFNDPVKEDGAWD
ncbi:hypothetical protein FQR65_LT15417 [Abscondita terminalis]|nr:hypothetical protein FQR65_LT15417 [Abscondita terminalis]